MIDRRIGMVLLLALTGCPERASRPVEPTVCERMGQPCRMPDGPMGVCPAEAPAPAPAEAPAPAPAEASAPAPAPAAAPGAAEPSREGWNDAQIDWLPYEEGLARARSEGRPVLLVMHADWCVHCRNYSHVFEDPRIVERARELVMIRIDVDDEPDAASRYTLDGGYVPRTYFLGPDGTTRTDVDARRARFRYFYDESDPASLLAAMETALAR